MTIFTCDLELNYRHTQLKWDKNKTNIFFLTQCTHTHNSENTHREHTPGAVGSHLCSGSRGEVGGSVSCSRAPQSWY